MTFAGKQFEVVIFRLLYFKNKFELSMNNESSPISNTSSSIAFYQSRVCFFHDLNTSKVEYKVVVLWTMMSDEVNRYSFVEKSNMGLLSITHKTCSKYHSYILALGRFFLSFDILDFGKIRQSFNGSIPVFYRNKVLLPVHHNVFAAF